MAAHDNNFRFYDFVFEKRFGVLYRTFTNSSLTTIEQFGSGKLKILDFGCGTGRLSIPLTQKGHHVFGVDICEGMLDILRQKANDLNLVVPTATDLSLVNEINFDLALSVFTVNNYISDPEVLRTTFQSIYNKLKSGGLFFLDLAKRDVYLGVFERGGIIQNKRENNFSDHVSIFFHLNLEHCNYSEIVSGKLPDGTEFNYEEHFQLRYWSSVFVKQMLAEIGFIDTDRNFHLAPDAEYFLFRKP
jgi:SAM-dependent methyltransferase